MHQGGSQYRRLVGAFQRVFGATIFFGTEVQRERATVIDESRFSFMSEARIWCSRRPSDRRPPPGLPEPGCAERRVLSRDHGASDPDSIWKPRRRSRALRGARPVHLAVVPLLHCERVGSAFRSSGRRDWFTSSGAATTRARASFESGSPRACVSWCGCGRSVQLGSVSDGAYLEVSHAVAVHPKARAV